MGKVKITVFKRVDPSVIFDGKVPDMPGSVFADGTLLKN